MQCQVFQVSVQIRWALLGTLELVSPKKMMFLNSITSRRSKVQIKYGLAHFKGAQ